MHLANKGIACSEQSDESRNPRIRKQSRQIAGMSPNDEYEGAVLSPVLFEPHGHVSLRSYVDDVAVARFLDLFCGFRDHGRRAMDGVLCSIFVKST